MAWMLKSIRDRPRSSDGCRLGGIALSVAAGTVGAMPVFALSTVHGPGWDDTRPIREQRAWDQHAAF